MKDHQNFCHKCKQAFRYYPWIKRSGDYMNFRDDGVVEHINCKDHPMQPPDDYEFPDWMKFGGTGLQ